MLFFILINVKMPTIVYEVLITSGPDLQSFLEIKNNLKIKR